MPNGMGWDFTGRDPSTGRGWWVDGAGNRVGWSEDEDTEIHLVASPPGGDSVDDVRRLIARLERLEGKRPPAGPDLFERQIVWTTFGNKPSEE